MKRSFLTQERLIEVPDEDPCAREKFSLRFLDKNVQGHVIPEILLLDVFLTNGYFPNEFVPICVHRSYLFSNYAVCPLLFVFLPPKGLIGSRLIGYRDRIFLTDENRHRLLQKQFQVILVVR